MPRAHTSKKREQKVSSDADVCSDGRYELRNLSACQRHRRVLSQPATPPPTVIVIRIKPSFLLKQQPSHSNLEGPRICMLMIRNLAEVAITAEDLYPYSLMCSVLQQIVHMFVAIRTRAVRRV